MERFAIFGAGGHGRVIADMILACGGEIAYVLDDAPNAKSLAGKEAITKEKFLTISSQKEIKIALAIGDNHLRKEIYYFFKQKGFEVPSIIHPSAIISEESIIKEACVIMPNVVVNAKISVGVGVILNTACVVEHDCAIGSFSHIAPRSVMCGGVSVGEMTHIGAGSVIIEGKKIGDSCLVGAGSVVINDIESFKKVVGNPAKKELK